MLNKQYFSLAWESHSEPIQDDSRLDGREQSVQWFQETATRYLRRQHGLFYSMATYDAAQGPGFTKQLYCNGRVAHMKDGMIVVIELRPPSALEYSLADENRLPIREWILSDRFVVALTTSP